MRAFLDTIPLLVGCNVISSAFWSLVLALVGGSTGKKPPVIVANLDPGEERRARLPNPETIVRVHLPKQYHLRRKFFPALSLPRASPVHLVAKVDKAVLTRA